MLTIFRNHWKYFLGQTLYQIVVVCLMRVSVKAGGVFVHDGHNPMPEWSTSLPLGIMILGTLLFLFPASYWLKITGPKIPYIFASLAGILGTGLALFGLVEHVFWLFCVGLFLLGAFQGIIQFIRFSAMEEVDPATKPKILSGILIAGIPAALLGPIIGQFGQKLLGIEWAGSYLLLVFILVVQLILSFSYRKAAFAHKQIENVVEQKRSAASFLRSNPIWSASLASAFAFSLMVLIMAAASPAISHTHGDESFATLVLTAHVLAMYLPSFFSSMIVKRIGPTNMILLGIGIMILTALVPLTGIGQAQFLTGLILLGIGWNFMYFGGNSLLITIYKPSEKVFVQGFHDILVFGIGGIGTLSMSALLESLGWANLNLLLIPFVLLSAGFVVFYKFRYQSSKAT